MRSRYTAYTLRRADYLLDTWHPAMRPETLPLDEEPLPRWLGLKIIATEGGGAPDSEGLVEFIARYSIGDEAGELHEKSRFVQTHGHWYYVDGKSADTIRPQAPKPARNAPCPCGSGKNTNAAVENSTGAACVAVQ